MINHIMLIKNSTIDNYRFLLGHVVFTDTGWPKPFIYMSILGGDELVLVSVIDVCM